LQPPIFILLQEAPFRIILQILFLFIIPQILSNVNIIITHLVEKFQQTILKHTDYRYYIIITSQIAFIPYQLNTKKTASRLNWEAVIIFMPFSYINLTEFLIDK